MDDLITRIESADAGSRELDAEVWWNYVADHNGTDDRFIQQYRKGKAAGAILDDVFPSEWRASPKWPHYTTSIDAALSLLPEGWLWRLWVLPDGMAGRAEIAPTLDIMTEEGGHYSHAATPALALCAAILKARNHDS